MSPFASLLALTLVAAPPPPAEAEPAWLPSSGQLAAGPLATATVETARFRIVHTPRAKGAAEFLAGQLEPVRDDIARLVGRDWPGVTELRLGYGREEYEALAPPGERPPSWAVALAWPDANVVLVEAHSLVQGDGQLTLRHELVHVALGQLGRGWPRWFQEGLAQSLTGERKFRVEHFATLTRAVTQDRVFRFEDLAQGFPRYPDDVAIAYAQSVAFVEFLRERHGPWAFRLLLDRVAEGDNFEKAFGVAFRSPLSVEETAFREELPRRYPWWPLLLSGGTLLWVAGAGLLVVGGLRRRRALRAWHAEQLRVETLQELARALPGRAAANDDVAWDSLPLEGTPMPWVVHAVRFHTLPGEQPAEAPATGADSKLPA